MAATRRLARAKRLIQQYMTVQRWRKTIQARLQLRKKQLLKQQGPVSRRRNFDLNSYEFSELSSSSAASDSDSDWSNILGSDWRSVSASSITSGSFEDHGLDSDIPDLLPFGHRGSDSSSESSFWESEKGNEADVDMNSSDAGDDSGEEFDDEDEDGDEEDDGHAPNAWERLRRWVEGQVINMYAHRYELPRDALPQGPSFLHHILVALKHGRADKFRESLRVTPLTFDAIVQKIETDPIFSNNSRNPQMPVEEQLSITLYRFGHDGNGASLQEVANWAGVGKGTVHLATQRVMAAVLRPEFMKDAVKSPTPEQKEEAKRWVHEHSCRAWRDGWCLVDGTLVPLYEKPSWFGESYFDRKCRYSLNIQVRVEHDYNI